MASSAPSSFAIVIVVVLLSLSPDGGDGGGRQQHDVACGCVGAVVRCDGRAGATTARGGRQPGGRRLAQGGGQKPAQEERQRSAATPVALSSASHRPCSIAAMQTQQALHPPPTPRAAARSVLPADFAHKKHTTSKISSQILDRDYSCAKSGKRLFVQKIRTEII